MSWSATNLSSTVVKDSTTNVQHIVPPFPNGAMTRANSRILCLSAPTHLCAALPLDCIKIAGFELPWCCMLWLNYVWCLISDVCVDWAANLLFSEFPTGSHFRKHAEFKAQERWNHLCCTNLQPRNAFLMVFWCFLRYIIRSLVQSKAHEPELLYPTLINLGRKFFFKALHPTWLVSLRCWFNVPLSLWLCHVHHGRKFGSCQMQKSNRIVKE